MKTNLDGLVISACVISIFSFGMATVGITVVGKFITVINAVSVATILFNRSESVISSMLFGRVLVSVVLNA